MRQKRQDAIVLSAVAPIEPSPLHPLGDRRHQFQHQRVILQDEYVHSLCP